MALTRLQLTNLNRTIFEFYGSRDNYDLDVPYQRGLVWTLEQKQNLIRSLLLGIPVGVIFANRVRFNPQRPELYANIVDGKQRITAIREFVDGDFSVPAPWFEEEDFALAVTSTERWAYYSDLSGRGRRKVDSSSIACYESNLPSLQAEAELYLLINFGGVPQTDNDRERATLLRRVAGYGEGG